MSRSPEQLLFISVLHKALVDATAPNPSQPEDIRAKHTADRWIAHCGRDFREICTYAGFDPLAISEAYNAGNVDVALLRAGDPVKKRKGAVQP